MAYGVDQYGIAKYGEDMAIVDYDSESFKPDLMRYLPHFLDGRVITAIMDAIAEEMGITAYNIYDMGMQILSVDTATHKLSEYERELGLPININSTYEERREIIKAKMRGSGTTTKNMIINIAESFTDGEVDVIEYPEEDYFVIEFIGVKGIPKNMKAFISILETIKPAHLGYNYINIIKYVEELLLTIKTYSFNVPYRICNMFRTADVKGGILKGKVELIGNSYYFDVEYPICNTFVAQGDNISNQMTSITLTKEYRDNEILFMRTGNTTIGEGDI